MTTIGIEEWKTCAGHPRYEVSHSGLVRRIGKQKSLRPWAHKSGHLYLRLDGKSRQVHLLVIAAFGPEKPNGCECRHLDGDPANNSAPNLQWGTRAQNIEDFRQIHGRHMRNNSTDVETARKIKEEHDGKHGTGKRLAGKYGVSVYTVSEIRNCKTFKYL